MPEKLIPRFIELFSQNLPFVFFRYPNSRKIHLYIQKDSKVYKTKKISLKGFVFAEFNYNGEHLLIKKDYSEEYLLKTNETITPNNTLEKPPFNHSAFIELVNKAQRFIQSGKANKVVVSSSVELSTNKKPWTLFYNLLTEQPQGFVYFFRHPKIATWIGASPEILLQKKKQTYKTIALAATKLNRPKLNTPWTRKELYEQQLVQDQIREDLDTFCHRENISVGKTSNLYAGHLVHLFTEYKFQTPKNPIEILLKLHPTSATAGRPKNSVMNFLKQNEQHQRSYYCGFLGPVDENEFSLYVNLRSANILGSKIIIYVGAGITINSDPEKEWEEILHKSQTISKILR